jgi:gentisate 1,2-dioxygenase
MQRTNENEVAAVMQALDNEVLAVPALQRRQYYERLDRVSAAPLWERLQNLVRKEPASAAIAAHWDYDGAMRALLLDAGKLISAEEAERRVLILENPALRGASSVTQTLYAGLQLVLPGEVAPAHRHSQSALRFIIEGDGAYTAVEGEKLPMSPGDLILTPSWTWHDHGNETDAPVVWLDGLDIPIVQFFDASFAEAGNQPSQTLRKPIGDASARFGENMAPVGLPKTGRDASLLHYRYAKSRAALMAYAGGAAVDPCHGYKMQYINPANGGPVMATIGAFLQFLPAGFRSCASRQTDGAVYSVVEGCGEALIGEALIRWKPRDVFVVPSWAELKLNASADSVLFSFSDRPIHEKLGLHREFRGQA